MSLPIIRLEKAIARDPARRLQTPVNFTLEQGEQIALIGRNGSGKSTLIEMITGTIPQPSPLAKELHTVQFHLLHHTWSRPMCWLCFRVV